MKGSRGWDYYLKIKNRIMELEEKPKMKRVESIGLRETSKNKNVRSVWFGWADDQQAARQPAPAAVFEGEPEVLLAAEEEQLPGAEAEQGERGRHPDVLVRGVCGGGGGEVGSGEANVKPRAGPGRVVQLRGQVPEQDDVYGVRRGAVPVRGVLQEPALPEARGRLRVPDPMRKQSMSRYQWPFTYSLPGVGPGCRRANQEGPVHHAVHRRDLLHQLPPRQAQDPRLLRTS